MSASLDNVMLSPKSENEIKELNPIVLAFIGDGVHTLYVRDMIVKSSNLLANGCHKESAKLCNAKSQANKLATIMNLLTDEEKDIVRRARNAKTHHAAKNSDEETYKKATSFEALIGYLYLLGRYDRIKELLSSEENV